MSSASVSPSFASARESQAKSRTLNAPSPFASSAGVKVLQAGRHRAGFRGRLAAEEAPPRSGGPFRVARGPASGCRCRGSRRPCRGRRSSISRRRQLGRLRSARTAGPVGDVRGLALSVELAAVHVGRRCQGVGFEGRQRREVGRVRAEAERAVLLLEERGALGWIAQRLGVVQFARVEARIVRSVVPRVRVGVGPGEGSQSAGGHRKNKKAKSQRRATAQTCSSHREGH